MIHFGITKTDTQMGNCYDNNASLLKNYEKKEGEKHFLGINGINIDVKSNEP